MSNKVYSSIGYGKYKAKGGITCRAGYILIKKSWPGRFLEDGIKPKPSKWYCMTRRRGCEDFDSLVRSSPDSRYI